MPFDFRPLTIPDVIEIIPRVHEDSRGFFMETYKRSEFVANGIGESFLQDNHSKSSRDILRGLHYQNPPAAQAKLMRAVVGRAYQVSVDVRVGSPTYGRWVSVILSEETRNMVYVPMGFANGFCTLSDTLHLVYKTTNEFAPDCEGSIHWNDPKLGIEWPVVAPIVSDRDRAAPRLGDADNQFVYESE